jgi:hypothetical protein
MISTSGNKLPQFNLRSQDGDQNKVIRIVHILGFAFAPSPVGTKQQYHQNWHSPHIKGYLRIG